MILGAATCHCPRCDGIEWVKDAESREYPSRVKNYGIRIQSAPEPYWKPERTPALDAAVKAVEISLQKKI